MHTYCAHILCTPSHIHSHTCTNRHIPDHTFNSINHMKLYINRPNIIKARKKEKRKEQEATDTYKWPKKDCVVVILFRKIKNKHLYKSFCLFSYLFLMGKHSLGKSPGDLGTLVLSEVGSASKVRALRSRGGGINLFL